MKARFAPRHPLFALRNSQSQSEATSRNMSCGPMASSAERVANRGLFYQAERLTLSSQTEYGSCR